MKWSISIYIYIYICQFTGRLVNSPLIRIGMSKPAPTLTIITHSPPNKHMVWFFNLAQHCNHHPTISILFGGGIILGLSGLPNCINLLIIVNHKPHQHQKMQTLQFGTLLGLPTGNHFLLLPQTVYSTNQPTQPNPTQPTTNIFLAPSGTVKKNSTQPNCRLIAILEPRDAESHPKKIQKVCYDPRF